MCRFVVGCGMLDGDGNGDSDGVCNRGGGLGFSWLGGGGNGNRDVVGDGGGGLGFSRLHCIRYHCIATHPSYRMAAHHHPRGSLALSAGTC